MTVVCWDGETLSADKMMNANGLSGSVTKIWEVNGHLVAGSGDYDSVIMMVQWFRDGCAPEKFPSCQRDKDGGCGFMVITSDKRILKYEKEPLPFEIEDKKWGLGSGRDFALGAMYMGAGSKTAVEVAIALCPGCGRGVDTLRLPSAS